MYWDSNELTQTRIAQLEKSKKYATTGRKSILKKIFGWKPARDNFVLTFFRESTLHGLKYIGRLQVHTFERIFWIIAVVAFTSISFTWIQQIYEKYQQNPVMVSFQPFEINLDQIPFPAVTICNVNNIRKSEAERIEAIYIAAKAKDSESNETKIAEEALNFLKSICDSTQKFSSHFGYVQDTIKSMKGKRGVQVGKGLISPEAQKLVEPALQNCSSMIRLCKLRNSNRNCQDLFQPIFTDIGNCCIFNGMPIQLLSKNLHKSRYHNVTKKRLAGWTNWNIDKQILNRNKPKTITPTTPRRQRRSGISSGLSILLEPELEEYFCSSYDSQGFQVLTDSTIDYPLVWEYGKAIPPDSEVFVNIRPELTMADDNIRSLSVKNRHCYFNNEYTLNYYNYYTYKNCNHECIANLTFKSCECAPFNMPRSLDQKICFENEYHCVSGVMSNVSRLGVQDLCKECFPGCTEITYDMSISSLPIQDSDMYKELSKNDIWADKHASVVHIYFGSDSVYSRVRKLLFGTDDLLASFGGILGLFLGFSMVSLVEIVYHFVLKVVWRKLK